MGDTQEQIDFKKNGKLIFEKEFILKLLAIMLPVAGQQAINMGVNMMDTMMLGSFGEVQLSASSLANAYYNFYNILCLGTIGGCSVLLAQYWGAKQIDNAKQALYLAMKISLSIGSVFAVITWLFPTQIMGIFSTDPAVIAEGVKYLRITTFVFIIHGIGYVTAQMMRAVRQATLGFVVSVVSFFVNIGANYAFIFGKFGAPRMEIAGAALGTLIARTVELIITFVYVFRMDKKLNARLGEIFGRTSKDVMSKYLKAGIPVFLSDAMLGIGNTFMSIILGRMGATISAAHSIMNVIDRMFIVMVQGMGSAAAIVTGNTVGEGKLQKAYNQGLTIYVLSLFLGLGSFLLMFLIGPLTIAFYSIQPETAEIARQMIMIDSVIMIFGTQQSIMTKGVLRGGGDTKFLMKADILFLWVVSLPLGIFFGWILHFPGWLTYLALRADYVIKSIWCLGRLRSGKWIRNITK